MIDLINRDYTDFVNLSSNLIGLDKAINNLQVPLGQLREEVMVKLRRDPKFVKYFCILYLGVLFCLYWIFCCSKYGKPWTMRLLQFLTI